MTDGKTLKDAQIRVGRIIERKPALASSTAKTSVRLTSGLRRSVRDGAFEFTADNSAQLGGTNVAPGPGMFGRGALGICAAQGYALTLSRHDISHRSIEVDVEGDSDLRGFLSMDVDVAPGYLAVRLIVRLETDADEDQVRAALDDADRRSPWSYNFSTALKIDRQVVIGPGVGGDT
jgi:uncharacterized OsmC-like protein